MEFSLLRCYDQFIHVSVGTVNSIAIKEQPTRQRRPMVSVGDDVAIGIGAKLCLLEEIAEVGRELAKSTGDRNIMVDPTLDWR